MTADPDQNPGNLPAKAKKSLLARRAMPEFNPDLAATMSFGDHLEELRRRIIFSLLGVIPLFVIAFAFGRPVLDILIEPARAQLRAGGQATSLLQTSPFETFGVVVQIALVITVLIGSPWILYQLWLFVAPGLYKSERRFFYRLAPMSVGLTALSIAFLYWVILPVILAFFIGYGSQVGGSLAKVVPLPEGVTLAEIPVLAGDPPADQIHAGSAWVSESLHQLRICMAIPEGAPPRILGVELTKGASIVQQYKIADYVKTLLNMGLAFGIGFQMPVVVLLLGWVGIVTREGLTKYRKHAVLGCAFAGAVLTPADPLSMILLAIPLYVLFELGVFLLKVWPPSFETFDAENA